MPPNEAAEIEARVRSAVAGEIIDLRAAVMGELGKLSRKLDETRAAVDRVADRQFEREHDEDRYRRRLKDAESELERISKQVDGPDWSRDPRDITGVHHLREVIEWKKTEEQRRHDSGLWWRRKKREWIVAGVGAFALATAGGIGTVVWWLFTHAIGGK